VLEEEAIDAPLMIVKGDGSLDEGRDCARISGRDRLSGPAASVVGAGFLTGLADFVVSDMGGTTTDIAIVSGGRPVISAEGALVGGWRTMVEAVDVRTSGLGGDSEVEFDRQTRLTVGPRKAMPLSSARAQLSRGARAAARDRRARTAAGLRDAIRVPQSRSRMPPEHLSALERRVWDALDLEPRRSRRSCATTRGSSAAAARRCGLATLAAFTPSDAMHVLGGSTAGAARRR
jgi:N-methylhydantoinase A/oxoprolinase/acetone carboxylase beta subunit